MSLSHRQLAFAISVFFVMHGNQLPAQETKSVQPEVPWNASSEQQEVDQPTRDAATKLAKDFLEHAYENRMDELFNLFSDDLKSQVDRAMMESFARQMRERLGKVEVFGSPVIKPFDSESTTDIVKLETDVMFEKGLCKPAFGIQEGKLVGFNIDSAELTDWFAGVDTIDEYRDFGQKFIEHFMRSESQMAFNMCHPALQKLLPEGAVEKMLSAVKAKIGDVKTIEFFRPLQEINSDSQNLYLYFHINGTKARTQCQLTIQFVGMKGHLVAFEFD